MKKQTTSCVVMVQPDYFGFNEQTAVTNVFQQKPKNQIEIENAALNEFNNMVQRLREKGIRVVTLASKPGTPDAVFPNNWFSHDQDGKLVIYPMLTPNRRAERQQKELTAALERIGIHIKKGVDLTTWENEGKILEGTGSIVLDRKNRIAYAMESQRTNKKAFDEWLKVMDYEGVFFQATDSSGKPIYHTNVAMMVGKKFAVVCIDAIKNSYEKELVTGRLRETGKEIIAITLRQLNNFCGNGLELVSDDGNPLIVFSENAYRAFTQAQKVKISNYGEVMTVSIPTIEKIGGGSARCMISEIFYS